MKAGTALSWNGEQLQVLHELQQILGELVFLEFLSLENHAVSEA